MSTGMYSLLHLESRSISISNLNLIRFVSTWQKRTRELHHRLRFEKEKMTIQMHQTVLRLPLYQRTHEYQRRRDLFWWISFHQKGSLFTKRSLSSWSSLHKRALFGRALLQTPSHAYFVCVCAHLQKSLLQMKMSKHAHLQKTAHLHRPLLLCAHVQFVANELKMSEHACVLIGSLLQMS